MRAKPGEIWLADLGLAAKTRPILIVSREDADPPRVLLLYVPLTRQNRGSAYEVEMKNVRFLNEISYANVQGLGSLPPARLERLLGKLSPELFVKVKDACVSPSISDSIPNKSHASDFPHSLFHLSLVP